MKVVIIGLGSIGKRHLAAINTLRPRATIYALRSRKDAPPVAGVTDLYAREEALACAPDCFLLANPTGKRAEVLDWLADTGIPLFIEKPALLDPSPAPAVSAKLAAANTPTYVACNLRFLESLQYVRDRMLREDLRPNEVNVYCGSYLPDWRPGQNWREVYSARPELGGGVHLDLIHELDYLYWFFGRPLEVSSCRRAASHLNLEVIDYAHYRLLYPQWVASVTLNYYRRDYRRTCEIVLPSGTWSVDLAQNEVRDERGTVLFSSPRRMADTYLTQMRHFLAVVEAGETSLNPFSAGVAVLKMALADD